MRPVLLALALLGCAHADLLRGGGAPSPLPADGASAALHREHGARAPDATERVLPAPVDAPMLHLRVSHRVTATPRLTLDPAVDKRVLRRLREPDASTLRLSPALIDLALDPARPSPSERPTSW